MSKGFIFSLDATMSLMIVAIIALLFTTQFQAVGPDDTYQASERTARDYAIVGSYMGKDAVQMGLPADYDTKANYACIRLYAYGTINADGISSSIHSEEYCKGIG
ncbi:MAG: hypothetical protein QF535_06700 [Anaerolineales bacterium]|jgi:hypothetical protein|nr:hypothetical protein [Anaerolineales bacterium]